MPIVDSVFWILAVALSSVGLTVIVRNAPLIRGLVMQAKKPWACNVCMPLYTCAVFTALSVFVTRTALQHVFTFFAAYALAYLILERASRPPGPPPTLPQLMGDDDE